MRRVVVALMFAALVGAAVPALAAEPESGSISAATPEAAWTGQIQGSSVAFTAYTVGGEDPAASCEDLAPSCDTFALSVADGPANVLFAAASEDEGVNEIDIVVEKPDGSTVSYTGTNSAKGTFRNMPSGDYFVHIYGVRGLLSGSVDFAYSASAARQAAAPPPPPAPPEAAPPPATLSVKVGRQSARRLARSRRLVVRLTATGRVENLVGTLVKGRRTLGSGRVDGFEGSGTFAVRLTRRVKPGRYALRLRGTDRGHEVTASAKVRVRR